MLTGTYDRLRGNMRILLEYAPIENFTEYPYPDRYSLTLLTQGSLSFRLNEEEFTLEAPFVLCTCYDDRFELLESGLFKAQTICFHPLFVNRALDYDALKLDEFKELNEQHDRNMMSLFNHSHGCNGVLKLPASSYLKISQWVKLMGVESITQSDGMWTCRIRRYLLQSLYLLDDLFMEQWYEQQEEKQSPVDKALEYIHTNYSSCIELSDVCNVAGVNRTKLNQDFKTKTGSTIIKYLNDYRLTLAKQSLIHTELKLEELADALGYRYSSYFITQFTKTVGMTPGEYREQNRIKRDPCGKSLENKDAVTLTTLKS